MGVFNDFIVFLTTLLKTWLFWLSAAATVLYWRLSLWPESPFQIPSPVAFFVIFALLIVASFEVWRHPYSRLRRLEHQDVDIRLEPLQGDKAIEFKLLRSYQLIPNLVPPEIDLLVNFEIVNRGGKSGSLLNVYPDEHKWGAEPDIQFRQSGLYAYYEEHRWDRSQVSLPESFQPDERRQASYRLHARIEVPTPEKFAELLRKLTDSSLEFWWFFRDEGEMQKDNTSVDVSFNKLKRYIYSTWEIDNRTDLIDIAEAQQTSGSEDAESGDVGHTA